MNTKTITAALLAASTLTLTATQASANRGYQPGNCAIYAEMLSETIKADSRVTGTAQSEAVETLDKYASYLDGVVRDGMADTYKNAAAFGMDKASVDAQMKAGEDAIRAGFTTNTMEKNTVYADHLLAVGRCAEGSQKAGQLGAADVAKMSERLNAVYVAIR